MGNPPFVGGMYMDKEQKKDISDIFSGVNGVGEMDYVCAWYKKASDLIQNTNTRCCFVSTNSITQGETVARFAPMLNIHYDFAYRTFVWDSESLQKAHVHCVIIGFSKIEKAKKKLYKGDTFKYVNNINAYLLS